MSIGRKLVVVKAVRPARACEKARLVFSLKLAPTLATILLLCPFAISQNSAISKNSFTETRFHALTPLGSDVLILQPAKKEVSVMLALDCKELGEARIVEKGPRKMVTNAAGEELTKYPSEMKFRFTAGSKTLLSEKDPLEVLTSATAEQFESHLHFRLKIFHGVEAQTVAPVESKIIGVPPEMPYDERIYRISFKLPDIPAGDRMMFEVLDDSGVRVAKFHLQLM